MSHDLLLHYTEYDSFAMFIGIVLIILGYYAVGLTIFSIGALFYLDEIEII